MSGGYHSVLYGKWHLGYHSWEHMPTMRGFDEFRGFLGGSVGQANHTDNGLYDWWNGTSIDISANGEYVAYLIEEYMYDLIDRYVSGSLGKPFFAYIPVSLPHGPLGAPAEYTELFEEEWGEDSDMTLWLSELKMLDDLVGNLWEYLFNTGVLWNTYIIFAGDHGSPQYDPSGMEVSRNFPFSGGKGTLWEGGVRCPAWIYNPSIPSVELDTPTSVTDWHPTLAELAGVSECDVPGNIDGMSLVDLWTYGEEDNYWRMLLVEVNPDCGGRRKENGEKGKEGGEANPSAAIRYGPYKLTSTCVDYNGSISDLYFYNLENDTEEATNLMYSDLADDEYFILYLMLTELGKLAQEAYPTQPNWNQGVYSPDLKKNCSCGYVDQMETVLPWSTCSRYYIGNAYENYTWVCEPYCTDAVGGVMPSAGVISNRAEGTNSCPTQSPTVTPSIDPTGVPTVTPTAPPTVTPTARPTATPTAPPTLQPSWDPTQPPSPPTQSPSLEPTEQTSLNPTHSPSVKTTYEPSTDREPGIPSSSTGRHPSSAPSAVPVSKIPAWDPPRDQTNEKSSEPITQTPSWAPISNRTKAPSLSPTHSSVEEKLGSTAHNLVPRWVLLAIGIALFAMILLLWRFKGRGQLSSIKLKRYTNHSSNRPDNVKLNKTVINGSQRTTTSEPLEAKISSRHSSIPFTARITNKRSASYISLMEKKGSGYGSVSCLL